MSKRHDTLPFDTIHLEGALFVPDLLEKVTRGEHTGQGEKDYHIPKGLKLHDEYGRAFQIAIAQWKTFAQTFSRQDIDQVSTTRNYVQELLQDVLGYVIDPGKTIAIADRLYHLPFLAFGRVPIFIAPGNLSLDDVSSLFNIEGSGSRKRSVFRLAQEFLNASPACTWAIVTNGRRIRLLRDSATLTRPCFLEFDLETVLAGNRYPDFAALWRTLHGSRAGVAGTTDTSCIWEQWRTEGQSQGTRVREGLRFGVTRALVALGNGFLNHPANNALRAGLQDGSLTSDQLFQEMLRLVYRFLFLFTLEERKDEQTEIPLLHPPDTSAEAQLARSVYYDGYSMKRLRSRVLRNSSHDRYDDLWQGLAIVFRSLYQGEPRLALPALGGLFSPDQCPTLDSSALSNRVLLETVYYLRWTQIDGAIAPVDYSNMGPEELGSVYESLLELVPVVNLPARQFGFVGITEEGNTSGHARKTTGSYYTPDSLVQELIKSALDPVIEARLAARPDNPTEALLAITVIDPACGSGHFLLAAARRLAEHLAELRSVDGAVRPEDYRHALREVVGLCIYGVDINPLAVELCRTALWLETADPEKPLGFLDAHIRHGNSLVGLLNPKHLEHGIPDDAYKTLAGDERSVVNAKKAENHRAARGKQLLLFSGDGLETLSACALDLDAMPEENLEQVHQKREAWNRIRHSQECLQEHLKADLFTAAFFAIKNENKQDAIPTSADLARITQGMPLGPQLTEEVFDLAQEYKFFHWHLAFPEVFAKEKGGFDVVLGNPPWDQIQFDPQEFFAFRDPEIANAMHASDRTKKINALESSNPALHGVYLKEQNKIFRFQAFVHGSKRYPLTSFGRLNLYSLFSELVLHLINPGGRTGIIVPSGIAFDSFNQYFFKDIVESNRVVSLFDFENKEKLFPAVDSRMKFSLLTLGHDIPEAVFLFFATRTEHLQDNRRRFTLTADDITLINPNTRTCPIFRSQADAELAKKLHRHSGIFINEAFGKEGNAWGVTLQLMFMMNTASGLFRTHRQLLEQGGVRAGNDWLLPDEVRYVPLYEAKFIYFYDHRAGSYETRGSDRGYRVLPPTELSSYQNPHYSITPYYWVPSHEVESRLNEHGWTRRWLMGWRDITSATNERSVIAGVIPRCACGDTFLIILPQIENILLATCLYADQCSIVHDYVARQKIGGIHIKFHTKKQIPVLPPTAYIQSDLDFILPRVIELTYTAHDLKPFAEDMGYNGPPFAWDPERRAQLRAELDAYYARLYGLTRDELRYILDPADIMGEDYPSETFRVLKNNDTRNFGEYRTQRLVLEAWDTLEKQNGPR